jgi:ABC-type Zn uptake system ZnuABC Zn-binding protein ZnuA
MNPAKTKRFLFFVTVLAAVTRVALAAAPPEQEPLSVAVTEPDIEAIVVAVGGNQVETFSLFKGCILRENLTVEPAVKGRLAKASVVVWTGFLNESAAITAGLDTSKSTSTGQTNALRWIDVSKAAVRANIPTSNCYGYVDPKSMSGDPFFWLNPKNGAVIAHNVAEGLAGVRPEKRAYFLANADTFKVALDKNIARWKQELKPLAHLRVLSTQCGWQNFSKLGGPAFVVCKGTPGSLPTPQHLVDRAKQMRAQIIIVDPNTPPDYGEAFRSQPGFRVIEVASSIENIPGARSYSALFENLIQALQAAAKN